MATYQTPEKAPKPISPRPSQRAETKPDKPKRPAPPPPKPLFSDWAMF